MIGIDIGASWIKVIEGRKKYKFRTPKTRKALIRFLEKFENFRVGVAIPGPVDIEKNKVLNPPNLKILHDFVFPGNFKIQNDAFCAALAEKKHWPYKNFIYLTLGTGIGSAFVLNDQVYPAEMGHIITPGKRRCGCGKVGCLETNRRYLSQALGSLVNIFSPEAVILGGGIVQKKNFKVPKFRRYVLSKKLKRVKIHQTKLDEFAGARGACYNITK